MIRLPNGLLNQIWANCQLRGFYKWFAWSCRDGAWGSKVDTTYPTVQPIQRWTSASSGSKGPNWIILPYLQSWPYPDYKSTRFEVTACSSILMSGNMCFILTIYWLFKRHVPFLMNVTDSNIKFEIPSLMMISSKTAIIYNGSCRLTSMDPKIILAWTEQGLSKSMLWIYRLAACETWITFLVTLAGSEIKIEIPKPSMIWRSWRAIS